MRGEEPKTSSAGPSWPSAERESGRPSGRAGTELRLLKRWIDETPDDATVKGMFIEGCLKGLERAGHQRPTKARYISFKDYPLRDYMGLLLEGAQIIAPRLPPSQGLRRLGHQVYPTIAESPLGRVLFSVAGKNWKLALTITEKAYRHSVSPGSAEVVEVTDNTAVVQLREMWNFADTYQVGVFEGAMEAYGVTGTVTPRKLGRRCDVDLLLKWT